MTTPAHDPISYPAHYTHGSIECIEAIQAALGDEAFVAFCRGNAMKYIWRTGRKDDASQDLQKAMWYLMRAVHVLRSSSSTKQEL